MSNTVETIELDGKRFYLINGKHYPSVTTVLGTTKDKSGLEEWRRRVGNEQADFLTERGQQRGTLYHEVVEAFLLKEKRQFELDVIDKFKLSKVFPILSNNVTKLYETEFLLYSHELEIAGRTDGILEWNEIPVIFDLKTSNKPLQRRYIKDYYLQVVAYALMANECFGYEISDGIILNIPSGENDPQIFIVKITNELIGELNERIQRYREITGK